jgi:hypothetical protein
LYIEPLTPEGRVTVSILRLNEPVRIEQRRNLYLLSHYPCSGIESEESE